jgi:hypothetical protein
MIPYCPNSLGIELDTTSPFGEPMGRIKAAGSLSRVFSIVIAGPFKGLVGSN